jgi:hypothetical protein
MLCHIFMICLFYLIFFPIFIESFNCILYKMEKTINILNGITYRSYVISPHADDVMYDCVPYGTKLDAIYLELNRTKRYMDNIPSKKLMLLRKILYPYHGIPRKLKIKNVTNAWLKTYEMLLKENVVNRTNKYTIFFNANAPGTSSMAFEYYMSLHHKDIEYEWVASSLIGNEALTDTYGIIANTKEKWLMDDNNDGDVTKLGNILDFEKKIKDKFNRGVDLYFSDIGIETKDYDREEHNEIKLVYCQNIIALMTMRRGGSMITKQRNFMTPFNLSMISFLSTLFSEFKIVKPETSRQLNSEIYLVGKNFNGISDSTKNMIFHILNNYDDTASPMSIPFGISICSCKNMLTAVKGIIVSDQIVALEHMEELFKQNNIQQIYINLEKYISDSENELLKRLLIKNI